MAYTVQPENIAVALLAGGSSSERSISLASGQSVEKALRAGGFTVTTLDPANKADLVTLIEGSFDVAFLALHGKYGEDGTIQGFLEIAGIPYTGPGVWSSATAINKPKTKELYARANIPTPACMILNSVDTSAGQVIQEVGLPCVVKAATQGSALGVYICQTQQEVAQAIQRVFEVDTSAFVEAYIEGEEYTVAVLGTNEPTVLPVIRIIPQGEFYDFESKYAQGGSQHICPAPISEADTRKLQGLALAAHQVLECRGVSRSDFIKDGSGKFWALETNTIPGMTETSLLPDAARAYGVDFVQLCSSMVYDALS